MAQQVGLRVDLATGFEGLGCLAASLDLPSRALELVGTATALRESARAPLSPGAKTLLDPFVEPARRALGNAAATTALKYGHTLPLQAASPLALQLGQAAHSGAHRGSSVRLTRRELEVANLIGGGLSNRQIAERLVVSERTVAAHVEHILEKLQFRSRLQVGLWVGQRAPATTGGTSAVRLSENP
jgi:DNA-binding CsgD family transcriptional regulator